MFCVKNTDDWTFFIIYTYIIYKKKCFSKVLLLYKSISIPFYCILYYLCMILLVFFSFLSFLVLMFSYQ